MIISSPAFQDQQPIPAKYTCKGEDVSPPLEFSGIPKGTKSLVLIVDDPDAPMGTFDHWIVWGIAPSVHSLAENTYVEHQGLNHFDELRYRGPCPPPGKPHRYFFKLYAIDTTLTLKDGSTKEEVEKAIQGHILSKATLIGTFQR